MRHHARRTQQGQSTLEYILVLAAIIGAVALAANGVLKTGIDNTMKDSGTAIEGAAKTLSEKLK